MPADEPPAQAQTKHAVVPQFAPVPRARDRSNGWKPEVQRAFIEALAETGSVKHAARRVGRAEVGAYLLRRHPQAEEFRRAWDAALDIGMRRIEDVAMERALHGVEVPVYCYGKIIGTRTVYNDRLLMFMLRNRSPERFSAGSAPRGPNAIDRMEEERRRKKWRKQWEEELSQREQADEDEVTAEIDAKLTRLHQDWLARMGPRTRAAWLTYKRTEAEEKGEPFEEPNFPRLPWLDAEEDGED